MQRTEEEQITPASDVEAPKIKWHCRKNNRDLPEDNPNCPDENIYCKFRTGCLTHNKKLLDD